MWREKVMVKISTESTADLEHLFKQEEINVIPLIVNLGGSDYSDGEDIFAQDIFKFYDENKQLPKTSARSIGEYVEYFSSLTADGSEVVHICLSSELSCTYSNAAAAAEEVEGVYVINSQSLSTGIGLLVLKAVDYKKEGKSAQEIVELITELVPRVQASFMVDTMEYLHKGGRCSGVTKLVAGVLKIKPTLYLKDGKIEVGQKYMGSFSKNILKYVEATFNKNNNPDLDRIFITHTYSSDEDVQKVREKIVEMYPGFKQIIETHAGSTITSHCGKNTLGILYINKE